MHAIPFFHCFNMRAENWTFATASTCESQDKLSSLGDNETKHSWCGRRDGKPEWSIMFNSTKRATQLRKSMGPGHFDVAHKVSECLTVLKHRTFSSTFEHGCLPPALNPHALESSELDMCLSKKNAMTPEELLLTPCPKLHRACPRAAEDAIAKSTGSSKEDFTPF